MKIGLITILTDDIQRLTAFYSDVLGFEVIEDLGNYVEFKKAGSRFAICEREVMYEHTNHESFRESHKGQVFELAFALSSHEEVDKVFKEVVEGGAVSITEPVMMPFGRYTAIFADPDGNIHEFYSLHPGETV